MTKTVTPMLGFHSNGHFCSDHNTEYPCYLCNVRPTVACLFVREDIPRGAGPGTDRVPLCQEHYDFWKVAAPLGELVNGND